MRSEGYSSCPVCVCPHVILAVCVITSKTKDTIVLSVEFEAIVKKVFFLNTSGLKVKALLLTLAGMAILP